MAAKTTKTEKTTKGPRWSIGLFRNAKGRLCTVYVGADGGPMPYERKRVGGREILIHRVYNGIKYSEARQQLLAEAKKAGLKDEPVVEAPKAEAAPAPETTKSARPKKPARAKKPVAAK